MLPRTVTLTQNDWSLQRKGPIDQARHNAKVKEVIKDNLPAIVKIVQDYFQTKSRAAAEKYFWRNSVRAYKWVKRDPSQP